MKIIGLTGSIAMGKSTAAKMLARMGYAHFDADAVVHALTGPRGRALPAIAAFAPEAVSTEAGMDRRRLGDLAFRDQSVLRKLEAVLHPMVYAENRRLLALWQRQRRRKVLLDVPLLLEGAGERTGAGEKCRRRDRSLRGEANDVGGSVFEEGKREHDGIRRRAEAGCAPANGRASPYRSVGSEPFA